MGSCNTVVLELRRVVCHTAAGCTPHAWRGVLFLRLNRYPLVRAIPSAPSYTTGIHADSSVVVYTRFYYQKREDCRLRYVGNTVS